MNHVPYRCLRSKRRKLKNAIERQIQIDSIFEVFSTIKFLKNMWVLFKAFKNTGLLKEIIQIQNSGTMNITQPFLCSMILFHISITSSKVGERLF